MAPEDRAALLALATPIDFAHGQVFAEPDGINIDRDNSAQLAFGFGIHQCLGQVLARIELQIIYERILARLPDLQLACPVEQLRFKHDMQIYGVHNLPVRW